MSEVQNADEESRKKGIAELIEKIKGIAHLTNLRTDEKYVSRFFYGASFNVDEAFERYKGFHEHIPDYPQIFNMKGPLELKQIIECKYGTMLPDCDREGRPIYIVKMANANIVGSTFNAVALDDVWYEYLFHDRPELAEKGLCYIMDVKNPSFSVVSWMTKVEHMKNCVRKANHLPFQTIITHIVNKSMLVEYGLKLIWPFLSEENKKNMRPHFTDYESLHKHIDPQFLPPEYGGTKEIDYDTIYQNIYAKNDAIVESYKTARNVKKI